MKTGTKKNVVRIDGRSKSLLVKTYYFVSSNGMFIFSLDADSNGALNIEEATSKLAAYPAMRSGEFRMLVESTAPEVTAQKEECIEMLALLHRSITAMRTQVGVEGLSPREREVMELLCDGRRNKEIGQTLHITERSVKWHVSNILRKRGCSNRVELFRIYSNPTFQGIEHFPKEMK